MNTQTTDEHQGPRPRPEALPIFVLGSVRSGTSITMQALRMGARVRGYYEGNVGSMVRHMLDRIDEQNGADRASETAAGVGMIARETARLRADLLNWLGDLYMTKMGDGEWFDKSPDSHLTAPMTRLAPDLEAVFPNIRFIWCARRGIENILSRLRKFPNVPFEFCCRSWAASIEQWFTVKNRLTRPYVEVHQHEIAIRPNRVAQEVGEALGFDPARVRAIADVLASKRFEQSRAAAEHRWMGLDETPWTDDQRAYFERTCGPAMRALRYPIEGCTLADTGPVRLFFPIVMTSVSLEGVAPGGFAAHGQNGLSLRPGPSTGLPATVRWLDVRLNGHDGFESEVRVPTSAPSPVRCRLEIRTPDESHQVCVASIEVAPGTTELWSAELPPLHGDHEIALSTQLTSSSESPTDSGTILVDTRLTLRS